MKFVENLFLKTLRPHFEKGGKLEKFFYAYEAGESFHFVTNRRTEVGAHVRDYVDLKRMMVTVVLAMIPCLLFGTWNAGYQQLLQEGNQEPAVVAAVLAGALKVLPLLLVVYTAGGIIEAIFAVIRKHEINEGFLVSGMLITLILPVSIPLWQAAVGTIFGVFIGKEVFGGTGMNILNPALTARAFLFFAYPSQIVGDQVWIAPKDSGLLLNGTFNTAAEQIVTQATPLGVVANQTLSAEQVAAQMPSTMEMFIGMIPGSLGETSTLCVLIGAVILVVSGVGSWKTMVSGLIGAAGMACFYKYGLSPKFPDNNFLAVEVVDQLVMGSFAFAIVFMATDPVSSAQTEKGKWIYGFLIGVLGMTIRVLNPAYPEGWMLAILFMNVFAPTIDHYVVKANVKRRMKRVA